MSRKRLVIACGTAAVVTAAAIGGGCYAVRTAGSSDSGYCALMPDAVGLYPGNPVTQMGYRVGHVARIDTEGDHVKVTFSLDAGRSYPADVKAVTRSKSILADRSLELVGNYHTGPRLQPGNCVALPNTATPRSLSEITGSAADFIDQIAPQGDTKPVSDAVDGLARALAGQGGDAHQLMLHAQQAMASPDRTVSNLGTIIHDAAPLTSQALGNWNNIHDIAGLLPNVITSLTYGAWPGVDGLIRGMSPLIAAIYEIQAQYGTDIWPLADKTADVIHLAATRSKDIQSLLSTIPSVAAFTSRAAHGDSNAIQWAPPAANGASVLDLVLGKGKR